MNNYLEPSGLGSVSMVIALAGQAMAQSLQAIHLFFEELESTFLLQSGNDATRAHP
jgi:ethanolamine utilization microcompartment shell protein EutL